MFLPSIIHVRRFHKVLLFTKQIYYETHHLSKLKLKNYDLRTKSKLGAVLKVIVKFAQDTLPMHVISKYISPP